jgi:hypothetical protein
MLKIPVVDAGIEMSIRYAISGRSTAIEDAENF